MQATGVAAMREQATRCLTVEQCGCPLPPACNGDEAPRVLNLHGWILPVIPDVVYCLPQGSSMETYEPQLAAQLNPTWLLTQPVGTIAVQWQSVAPSLYSGPHRPHKSSQVEPTSPTFSSSVRLPLFTERAMRSTRAGREVMADSI